MEELYTLLIGEGEIIKFCTKTGETWVLQEKEKEDGEDVPVWVKVKDA